MAVDIKYGRVTVERGLIGEDEPVVVFRAQDLTLPALLRVYWEMCRLIGSPDLHLDAVDQATEAVLRWQADNVIKIPDTEILPEAGA